MLYLYVDPIMMPANAEIFEGKIACYKYSWCLVILDISSELSANQNYHAVLSSQGAANSRIQKIKHRCLNLNICRGKELSPAAAGPPRHPPAAGAYV